MTFPDIYSWWISQWLVVRPFKAFREGMTTIWTEKDGRFKSYHLFNKKYSFKKKNGCLKIHLLKKMNAYTTSSYDLCTLPSAQSRIPYSLTKADGKTLQGFANIFHGLVSHLQICPAVCLHSEINTGHAYLTVKGLNVLRQREEREARNLRRNEIVSGNVRQKAFF